MTATISGHKELLLEHGGGGVKETPSNLLTATNPAELSEEMWIQKSPARVKTFDDKKKKGKEKRTEELP